MSRLFVRVITRPHHRPGFHMAETKAQGFLFQIGEFFGRIEARHGQMIARRA